MSKTEAEICKECGGSCCKATGCSLSPEDMLRRIFKQREQNHKEEYLEIKENELTKEQLENWLIHSDCAIDSFGYEKGRLYYLRMRHKCFTFIGVDAMGECMALRDDGCCYTYEERPKGGRSLKASEDRRCRQEYTREMMVKDWMPYQELLREIWNTWYDRFQKDGTFDKCEEAYMDFQRSRYAARKEQYPGNG